MSEVYYELIVEPKDSFDSFEEILAFGVAYSFEIGEGRFVFAFDDQDDLENAKKEIEKLASDHAIELKFSTTQKEQNDWIKLYKESIDPVVCGSFRVRPSWHKTEGDFVDIVIDPSLSFGTGHHETTCGVLKALGKLELDGKSLLDVGCGSGILAIACSKMGAVVSVCDTDPDAVNDTKANFELNCMPLTEAWIGSVSSKTKAYDVVIANIVTDVLIAIKDSLISSVKSGGVLVLSGILERYASRIEKAFEKMQKLEVTNENGWLIYIYKRREE